MDRQAEMHQFGIRGGDGCIEKWKFWIGRKIMNDYQAWHFPRDRKYQNMYKYNPNSEFKCV